MNPSERIDELIAGLTDWRGKTLASIRKSILEADREIVEEWKWMGSPVWSRDGIIAVGNAHKDKVKLTFAHGASLADPDKLFNDGLEGKVWRAIDFFEGDKINERALKTLVRAAVAYNQIKLKRKAPASTRAKACMSSPFGSSISIRGARENNLKDVTLQIPKRKLTIFTGVSGSGKSSIVFDTLATEAQRQLYENFSLFIRNFLPKYPQPDADAIENLPMAVIVDQKRLGGGSHSTVGTVTDIHGVLRLLFSRVGKPPAGGAIAYSFNDPRGACPECNGLGKKIGVVSDDFLDMSKSLNEGAVQVPFFGECDAQAYTLSGYFDNDKKLSKFTKDEMELLLHGKDRKFKVRFGGRPINLTYAGHHRTSIERNYIQRDIKTLSERTQKAVMPYLKPRECPSCKGARLSPAALASKINGHNIADLASMEVGELLKVVRAIKEPKAGPILHALVERLQAVVDIGLEYLSLNRETDTLSGGESQRVRMVKHLGSSLVDVMYIFDEPSVGLHPRDVHRLNELLGKLRDKGNTVIVVEHDPAVIQAADHIVDVGPGAGNGGGTIVFEGTYEKFLKSDTLTGRHLTQALPIKKAVRKPAGPAAHQERTRRTT